MLPTTIRRQVDVIWDKIWASGISNPLTAVEYFSTVLLLRRLSEGPRSDPSRSPWADLIELIDAGDAEAVAQHMVSVQTSFGIGASPDIAAPSTWRDLSTLRTVLDEVDALEITDRNVDVIGDLFEYILNHVNTAGHFGQFRTPRHLMQFLVESLAPRPGEMVVDPACGTGGFLIAAHEYRGGIGERYLGHEVDATMARIAGTNVLLHDMAGAAIHHGDGLQVHEPDADVVLANPPFAGTVMADRVRHFQNETLKTELLFVELIMRRVKPGGRAGVIVPTGVLTSSSSAAVWIRRQLVEGNRLHAVVELPSGTFRPYTGVKTGVLFWNKKKISDDILMMRIENDGYSLDDRRQPIDGGQMESALALLRGEESNLAHTRVSISQVMAAKYNLNPSRYISTPPTADLESTVRSLPDSIADARTSLDQIAEELTRLEGLLG